jgi:hypothetical protein
MHFTMPLKELQRYGTVTPHYQVKDNNNVGNNNASDRGNSSYGVQR